MAVATERIRLGIAGLDHWYIGLEAARAAAADPDVELVVVAHREHARARETAARFGAAEASDDPLAVVRRDDLDVVVTACRSSENADLCIEAARHGLHIISVKPIAMTREAAARIKEAVDQAGVHFFSWESQYRLDPRYQQMHEWIAAGRIGRPVSGLYVLRSSLPTQVWPGVDGATWWLDPAHVPGGGWLDHAIYSVDLFRWLLHDEVATVAGMVATLVHRDLPAPLEDFGMASLAFEGGSLVSAEVTWTGAPGAFFSGVQVVGSEGAMLMDSLLPGRIQVSGHFEPFGGWSTVSLPSSGANPVAGMVQALREQAPLPAGIDDACRNLAICLSFYEAARAGVTRPVSLRGSGGEPAQAEPPAR